ncbi:conjugal transfer protein TraB [Mycoavidus sp. B2-EB]|uniref:conjugal transfer protein TraB n=1 Tax=Mycoavidus sp. B2-EB TaxID=2651972 RepID=UPI0016267C6E|nr:conjugal transfer protein TraB [Mycoavidus sp. B2-EB]
MQPPRLIHYSLAGTTIALLAWFPGHWLASLALLPWLWRKTQTPQQAAALWISYYLTGARDIPCMCARFFSGHNELPANLGYLLGGGFWLTQAALLSIPWMLFHPASHTSASKTLILTFSALLFTQIPPLGIIGWLSPLHISSALYPGWGGLGLLLGIGTLCLMAANLGRNKMIWLILCVACMVLNAHKNEIPPTIPSGWQALDLQFGRLDQSTLAALFKRTEQVQNTLSQALAQPAIKIIVLPEEIVGLWHPALAWGWHKQIRQAAYQGQTFLLGADILKQAIPLRYTNSVLALGHNPAQLDSRMPMPIGLWRPGAKISAVTGKLTQPYLKLDGLQAALSICYEDFLWWPHWRLFFISPDLLISLSNQWFNSDLATAKIQQQSIHSLARLVGVPLLRSTNR